MSKTGARKWMKILYGVIGVAMVLLIWSGANALLGNTRVPSPWHTVKRLVETAAFSPEIRFQGAGSRGFYPHVLATLYRYLAGTGLGIVLSFACLFFCVRFRSFRDYFTAVVDILRAVPPLAVSPFLLLWFGTTPIAIIGVVVFYVFVMVFVAGMEAVDKLDPAQVNFARTLGAGDTAVAREVVIPGLMPTMSGPIKAASCWSWGLVIVGELLGAKSGIGRILNSFIALTATDLVMVGILWILMLAILMERVVAMILKWMLRWNVGINP